MDTEKKIILCDLDGTLVSLQHRMHFILGDSPDWTAFYAACIDDTPKQTVIDLINELLDTGHYELWILSARSDEALNKTKINLARHGVYYQTLIMRPGGDYTPDHELKKLWLDRMLIEDRERVAFVFDDRNKVVKMWREQGLTCFQVAEGNF